MTRKRLGNNTERLITQFFPYLTAEKGISEETASAHAHQIDFFASHYLRDYEDKSLLDASGMDIENYLGDWYIRKVLNSTKSDVRPALVAFKKFFKFLYETQEIGKEQLDDILEACANPQRYIRRFETYFELDPESETWNEEFEEWSMGYEEEIEEIEEDYEQPYEVKEEINRAFSEKDLNASKTTILNDFQTFLNYISANNGMKLTAANSFIVRNHVFALNEVMSSPEELKSTANQPDSRTIHLFYNLSRTLGLFAVSAKNTLEITPRTDIFKLLSPKEQFVVLFDAMWTETSWEKFLAPYSGGRPEWAQARRGDIALLFSQCEPREPYPLKEVLSQVRMAKGLTEYDFVENIVTVAEIMIGVFGERIMPALKLFRLLDFGFTIERDKYFVRHGVGIEWFSITKFGKKIFRVLAQEG
ncbi:MAG TPA: site-specific integrase [Desulfobacteria bacterium]|nr:site-specific integrase [Desulfobacteria bacterium]